MRPSTRWRCAAGVLAAGAGVWLMASAGPAPGAPEPGKTIDRYRLLVERNIFLRDRRVYVPPIVGPALAPRDPDSSVVLTGIAVSGGRYVAFFENSYRGSTSRIAAGQAIGMGKVKSVTLDGVVYERDGAVRPVSVGHSLMGTARVLPAPAVAGRPPTSAPAATTAPTEGGNGTEVASADGAAEGTATAPADGAPQPPAAVSAGNGGDEGTLDLIEQMMRRRRERDLSR